MKNNTIAEIASLLQKAKTVAVFCHIRPDGDALGSGLALVTALENAGKRAYLVCEEAPPEKFNFLPAMQKVKTGLPDCCFDTMVSVDCADLNRLGAFAKAFTKFDGVTVNIDHHISNEGYAKYNYISVCPATCEIMTEVLRASGFEILKETANLLMLGLITDSGNFTHMDVSPKTYETAAYLRGNGADMHEINYNMYGRQTRERALLYGKVMSKMRFELDGALAIIVISADDLIKSGADRSQTEGFVDFPLSVDGVEVAVSVMEFKENQYKVSLRSKGKVNVSELAAAFGGGGHVLASGCMLFGPLEEVIDKLTYAVYQNL